MVTLKQISDLLDEKLKHLKIMLDKMTQDELIRNRKMKIFDILN